MRESWPLWNCIPEETRELLSLYQYHRYGISIEPTFKDAADEPDIESTEEIETLMQTPPTRSRGVY